MSRDRRCASLRVLTEHFDFVKKLGQGSFSEVHLVRLKQCLSQQYALKCLVKTTHPRRAETECRILRQLGGKENVMKLFCSFRKDDRTFLCMEYFPHVPFQVFCEDASMVEIRDYMKNLFIALAYIHKHGIIHHDIKPSNFLYDRQRKRYALIDFGLAETMSKPAFLPEPKGDASKSNVIMRGKRKLDFTSSQPSPSETSHRPNQLSQPAPLKRSPRKIPATSSSFRLSQRGALFLSKVVKEEKAAIVPLSLSLPTTSNVSRRNLSPFAKPIPTSCGCFGRSQYCHTCMGKRPADINLAGTAGFRAPETLMTAGAEYQTSAIDMWACGVILLSLLSRRYPFMKMKYCGESLAALMTLMGTQHVAGTAKALGVKILYQEYCPKLDFRELCCWFRLRGDVSNVEASQHRREPCAQCSNSFKADPASDDKRKLFCLCHPGRKEYRGPLFVHCVQKEFARNPKTTNGDIKEKAEENTEEEHGDREKQGLMFDQAFDLLSELLELNPLYRIRAPTALDRRFFFD